MASKTGGRGPDDASLGTTYCLITYRYPAKTLMVTRKWLIQQASSPGVPPSNRHSKVETTTASGAHTSNANTTLCSNAFHAHTLLKNIPHINYNTLSLSHPHALGPRLPVCPTPQTLTRLALHRAPSRRQHRQRLTDDGCCRQKCGNRRRCSSPRPRPRVSRQTPTPAALATLEKRPHPPLLLRLCPARPRSHPLLFRLVRAHSMDGAGQRRGDADNNPRRVWGDKCVNM